MDRVVYHWFIYGLSEQIPLKTPPERSQSIGCIYISSQLLRICQLQDWRVFVATVPGGVRIGWPSCRCVCAFVNVFACVDVYMCMHMHMCAKRTCVCLCVGTQCLFMLSWMTAGFANTSPTIAVVCLQSICIMIAGHSFELMFADNRYYCRSCFCWLRFHIACPDGVSPRCALESKQPHRSIPTLLIGDLIKGRPDSVQPQDFDSFRPRWWVTAPVAGAPSAPAHQTPFPSARRLGEGHVNSPSLSGHFISFSTLQLPDGD